MATSAQMQQVWNTVRASERRTPAQQQALKSARMAAYRQANAETLRAYNNDPTRNKFWSIKKNYGLTKEQWVGMLETQAGLCAVCCLAMTPGRDTCVDHDHNTGAVRGLVCRKCNVMLGQSNDSALTLQGGADYLGAA